MPTYREIAAAAGVSVATVSFALRGLDRVKPETRREVLRVARELGYVPNPMVTALMTAVRRQEQPIRSILALLVPRPSAQWARHHPGLSLVVAGARAQAESAGYGVDEISLRGFEDRPEALERALRTRGTTGVMWIHLRETELLEAIDWSRFSVCVVGAAISGHRFHTVSGDYTGGIGLVVSAIRERSCRRAGLVLSALDSAVTHRQYEIAWTYHREVERGRPEPLELLPAWITPDRPGKDEFLAWVIRNRPDLLVTGEVKALDWLREAGIRVPEDVAILSLDAAQGGTSYTGVDQRHRALGATAADILIRECQANRRGEPALPYRVTVDAAWTEGATL